MAPNALAFTLAQLIVFLVAIVVRDRIFAPKRLTGAELTAQIAMVRRFIEYSLRSSPATSEDVDDLTQDVMVAAWEASKGDR